MSKLNKKQLDDLFKVVDIEYRNIIIGMEFKKRKIIELWTNTLRDLAYQVHLEYTAELAPVVRITLAYLRRTYSEYDIRQKFEKHKDLDIAAFRTVSKGINDLVVDNKEALLYTTFQLMDKLTTWDTSQLVLYDFIGNIDEMTVIGDYVKLKTMTKDEDLNKSYKEVYNYINEYGSVREQFNKLSLDEKVQTIDIIANAWNGHDEEDEISDLFYRLRPLFIPKLGIKIESGLLRKDNDGNYRYLETETGIIDITKPLYKRYVLDRIEHIKDFVELDDFIENNLKDFNYFTNIKWGEI